MMVAAPMSGRNTQGGKASALSGALHLIQQRADNNGPGGAPSGWPMAIAPPFTFTLLSGHIKSLHESQHHGGESPRSTSKKVNIRNLHSAVAQDPFQFTRRQGRSAMIVGSVPILAVARILALGFQTMFFAKGLTTNQHPRGPIDNARRIARVVNMFDFFKMRVFHQRHLVEAGHHRRPCPLKAGFHAPRLCHIGAGAQVFVRAPEWSGRSCRAPARWTGRTAPLATHAPHGAGFSTANASAIMRVNPYSVAIISAEYAWRHEIPSSIATLGSAATGSAVRVHWLRGS